VFVGSKICSQTETKNDKELKKMVLEARKKGLIISEKQERMFGRILK